MFVNLDANACGDSAKHCDDNDNFHFRMACSNTALNKIGLSTSPCLTPREIREWKFPTAPC